VRVGKEVRISLESGRDQDENSCDRIGLL